MHEMVSDNSQNEVMLGTIINVHVHFADSIGCEGYRYDYDK